MDDPSQDSIHPGIVYLFLSGAGRQQAQPYSGNMDEKEVELSKMLISSMKESAQLFLPKEACERSINVLVNNINQSWEGSIRCVQDESRY